MVAYVIKLIIRIIGGIIGIIAIINLYKYLTRHLSVNKIKLYLSMCIKTLDYDLKNSLISNNENSFNFILEKYLSTNDENLLTKLASFIAKKYPVSKYSVLTDPANVMRSFLKCICDEQLGVTYKNGYLFRFINYEELQKKAPFVTNFCFIASSTNYTYVDFISGSPYYSIDYLFMFPVTLFYTKATNFLETRNKLHFVPKKIIFLAKKTRCKSYFTYIDHNNTTVRMPDGVKYRFCSAIIRGGMSVSRFKQFGGDEFNQDEINEIKSLYQHDIHDYFAVGALKEVQ